MFYVICKQRHRSACASAQSNQHLCFRCLDSIISLNSIVEISRLQLGFVDAQAGLSLTWSETPKHTFCHVVAHILVIMWELFASACDDSHEHFRCSVTSLRAC